MDYYYSANGKSVGPVSREQLTQLFIDKAISLDTGIWQPQMPEWQRLRDMPELSEIVTIVLPPPIKPAAPVVTAVLPAAPPDFYAGHDPYARAVPPILVIDAKPAGPWSRFFARLIDTMVTIVIVGALAAAILRLLLPLDVRQEVRALMAVFSVPVILVANFILQAAIIALFGNSIGKAIFGIRAVPLNRQGRANFTGALARELRVLVEGLAFYLPIASQVTMFAAWRDLKKGRPTSYDQSRAMVIDTSGSPLRRGIGVVASAMMAFMLLLVGNGTLPGLHYSPEDAYIDALLADLENDQAKPPAPTFTPPRPPRKPVPKPADTRPTAPWTNPETGIVVTIPAEWRMEKSDSAIADLTFRNPRTSASAYLSCEASMANSVMTFTKDLVAYDTTTSWRGPFEPSSDATVWGVWLASGTTKVAETELFFTTVVRKVGKEYCTIQYIEEMTGQMSHIDDQAFTRALLKSVDGPPVAEPAAETPAGQRWTNPITGLAVTIPAAWQHSPSYGGDPAQIFTNHPLDQYATLLCDSTPFVSMAAYLDTVKAEFNTIVWDRPFLQTGENGAQETWQVSTYSQDRRHRITAVASRNDHHHCVIIYNAPYSSEASPISHPAFTKALFDSMDGVPTDKPAIELPASALKPAASAAVSWTNHETGIEITLPTGWKGETANGAGVFTYAGTARVAFMACRFLKSGVLSIDEFASSVFDGEHSRNPELQPFAPTDNPDSLLAIGISARTGGATNLLVAKVGGFYCKILYEDGDVKQAGRIDDPALTAVLLQSLEPVSPPQ